jgi:ribonuclease Z
LHVPELKLGLDAGTVNGRQPEVVFLTHTHIDHSKDLAYICQRNGGCTVYCPKEAVPFIDQWIRAEVQRAGDGSICHFFSLSFMFYLFDCRIYIDLLSHFEINLNNCGEWRTDAEFYKYKLVGVQGGDVFFMGKSRVTVVDMIHAVPCIGFLVENGRTKLKAEVCTL